MYALRVKNSVHSSLFNFICLLIQEIFGRRFLTAVLHSIADQIVHVHDLLLLLRRYYDICIICIEMAGLHSAALFRAPPYRAQPSSHFGSDAKCNSTHYPESLRWCVFLITHTALGKVQGGVQNYILHKPKI